MTPGRYDLSLIVGDAFSASLHFEDHNTQDPEDLSAYTVLAKIILPDGATPKSFTTSSSVLASGIIVLALTSAETTLLPPGLHPWWLTITQASQAQTILSGYARVSPRELPV